jgi:MFS transporter, DHA3 family, macrolide efflux protein
MMTVGRSFATPASKALVVQLVKERDLEWAFGLLSANNRVSQAIGPALGGFIVSALGMPMMFFLDAMTFALSGGICSTIRLEGVGQSFGRRFDRGVIDYIRQQRSVRLLIVFIVCFGAVLTPMYIPFTTLVKRDLKLDAAVLGLFLTAFAGGFTLSALLLMRWIRRVAHHPRVLGGALATGVFLIGASRTGNPWVIGACLALAGVGYAVTTITLDAWLQRLVHDDIRGRVLSVLGIMMVVSNPLAYLLAGLLVEVLGAVSVIALLGAAAITVGIAVFAMPGILIHKDDKVEPA